MGIVAFRDASGNLGVFLEACPHVGTQRATFTRGWVEADGLRCKFHGWKYNVDGACIDIPDVAKDADFGRYPRAAAFETREADGDIWINTGRPSDSRLAVPENNSA